MVAKAGTSILARVSRKGIRSTRLELSDAGDGDKRPWRMLVELANRCSRGWPCAWAMGEMGEAADEERAVDELDRLGGTWRGGVAPEVVRVRIGLTFGGVEGPGAVCGRPVLFVRFFGTGNASMFVVRLDAAVEGVGGGGVFGDLSEKLPFLPTPVISVLTFVELGGEGTLSRVSWRPGSA